MSGAGLKSGGAHVAENVGAEVQRGAKVRGAGTERATSTDHSLLTVGRERGDRFC